jgi:hypothetical protein
MEEESSQELFGYDFKRDRNELTMREFGDRVLMAVGKWNWLDTVQQIWLIISHCSICPPHSSRIFPGYMDSVVSERPFGYRKYLRIISFV